MDNIVSGSLGLARNSKNFALIAAFSWTGASPGDEWNIKISASRLFHVPVISTDMPQ